MGASEEQAASDNRIWFLLPATDATNNGYQVERRQGEIYKFGGKDQPRDEGQLMFNVTLPLPEDVHQKLNEYKLTNLDPTTWYGARVRSMNKLGWQTEWSKMMEGTVGVGRCQTT